MTEFVLLYRRPYLLSRESPERVQQSLSEWRAWMKEMTDKGHLKSYGQPLDDDGRVVAGKKKTVTDGPYAETKDIVGGYSIIEAKNLEEAARIASGCPILAREGSVEIRPVRQLDM